MFQTKHAIQVWFLWFLFNLLKAQINIVPHPEVPVFTAMNIYAIDLNQDGSEMLMSLYENEPVVARFSMNNGSNIARVGAYHAGVVLHPSLGFTKIYQVKDYLIASNSNTTNPLIFNLTSYARIGQLDKKMHITSLKYVSSKDIIIFGTNQGLTYYSSMSTFPNPNSLLLYDAAAETDTFAEVSPDQKYVSISFRYKAQFIVFNMTHFFFVNSVITDCWNNTHVWSPDSRYVVLFPACNTNVIVYDSKNSWSVVRYNIFHTDIRFSFNYLETNVLVMIPSDNNAIVTMNWYDFSFMAITNLSLSGKYGKLSGDNKVFGVFLQNLFKAWFFKIQPFCQPSTVYKISAKACVSCPSNCIKCTDVNFCTQCASNFSLANSLCESCGPNTLYNSTTLLCDDISSFCSGDQYFSIPLLTCVQCQPNCIKCSSTTVCQTCGMDFVTINGSCLSTTCKSSFYFDSFSLSCQKCSFNCLQCFSQSQCILCAAKHSLLDGQCKSHQEVAFQQIIRNTLENDAVKFTNRIPGNRILLSQIFSFFINIDHLWLYIYHKRSYGSVINNFLTSVNNLQQQKWQFLNEKLDFQDLRNGLGDIEKTLNFKQNQTSWKFLEIENQSSSFFENTLNFFFLNLPLVLVVFLLFKAIAKIKLSPQLSSFFREYKINLFFFYMVMQGNMQSFTYYLFYDLVQVISRNSFQRFINGLTIVMAFIFIVYVFAGQMIIYTSEGKHSKFLMKNFEINLKNIFFATFHITIINFFLGACHILAENDYQIQLIILTSIQTSYIALLAFSLRAETVYTLKYIGWQYLFASFLRIILILTFAIDKDSNGALRELFNLTQMVLIILYLLNWILAVFMGYGELVRTCIKSLLNRYLGVKKGERTSVEFKRPEIKENTLRRPMLKERTTKLLKVIVSQENEEEHVKFAQEDKVIEVKVLNAPQHQIRKKEEVKMKCRDLKLKTVKLRKNHKTQHVLTQLVKEDTGQNEMEEFRGME